MLPPTPSSDPNVSTKSFQKLRLILAAILILIAAAAAFYFSGYMPGTVRTHVEGLWIVAWGTGDVVNYSSSGAVQSRHTFRAGHHLKSQWFKPDGTMIDETAIQDNVPAQVLSATR